MANGSQQTVSPQQQNAMVRQLILRGGPVGNTYFPPAVDMWQQLNPILPSSVGPGSVITIQLRNVGLVKRLVVEFSATVTAGATSVQTLTPLGLANLISNITFVDLGNNTRINSTGWHLNLVSSVKRRRVFGAAYTNDSPNGYAAVNNRIMYAPSSISANGTSEIDFQLAISLRREHIKRKIDASARIEDTRCRCVIVWVAIAKQQAMAVARR